MADRKIENLDPRLQPLVIELLKRGNEAFKADGLTCIITDGKRSLNDQMILYGKGRTVAQLQTTGHYTAEEAAQYAKPKEGIVTKTLDSMHRKGLAVDISFTDVNGKLTYVANFEKLAAISKSLGLDPGFYWTTFQDKPHHQYIEPAEAPPIPHVDSWRLNIRTFSKEQKLLQDVDSFVNNPPDMDKILAVVVNANPALKSAYADFLKKNL